MADELSNLRGLLTKGIAVGFLAVLALSVGWMEAVSNAELPNGADMARLIQEDKLAIMTIAQEALVETFEGKLAVAEVIRNRMKAKYMSDGTVEGTVLKPYQFSGWLPGDPVLIKSMRWEDDMPAIQECTKAWFDAKQGSNTVNGAVLYFAPVKDGVEIKTPKWALPEHATKVAEIGAHHFYVPKPS